LGEGIFARPLYETGFGTKKRFRNSAFGGISKQKIFLFLSAFGGFVWARLKNVEKFFCFVYRSKVKMSGNAD